MRATHCPDVNERAHAPRQAGAAALHEHLMDEHSLEAYDEPTLTVAVAAAVGRPLVVLPDMMRAAAAPAKAHKGSTNTEMSMIPSRKFNMRQVTGSSKQAHRGRARFTLPGRTRGRWVRVLRVLLARREG